MKGRVSIYSLVFAMCSSAYADAFFPTLDEWKASANFAAKDPATWLPLGGAILIKATNSDQHISEWASENRPVFGDHEGAAGKLTDSLVILGVTSLLFSPQQESSEKNWVTEKGIRLAEMFVATDIANRTTDTLKDIVQRKRPSDPEGNDSYSFPSFHATKAFGWAALTRRNLEDYNLSNASRIAWDVGIYTIASGSAWARVETNTHYPTDVLVGAAIGNFVAGTIYRAFVGDPAKNNLSISVDPIGPGAALSLYWTF